MRPGAAAASALLMIAACSGGEVQVGSAPSTATREQTTTQAPAGTVSAGAVDGPIRGTLPEGTVYEVIFEPLAHQEVESVSAGVVIEDGSGATTALGEVRFIPGPVDSTGWVSDDLLRLAAGDWTVELGLSDAALSVLGDNRQTIIEDSVVASTNLGLPVLDLSPPLAWAPDDQSVMEVAYHDFVVRRSCEPHAVACSSTHAVQLLALGGAAFDEVWIETYALRPSFEPHYLDPGPLGARTGHDVIWTGSEMIVWGGYDRSTPLVDGAAFDPGTDSWRLLPPPPIGDDQTTRAIWAGEEMIVVSGEATLGFDPTDGTWRVVAEGGSVPERPGRMVWTGSTIITYADDGMEGLEPTTGRWVDVPDPDVGDDIVLRVSDRTVLAVGAGVCDQRLVAEWTGQGWRRLPDVTLATSRGPTCSSPVQTAMVAGRVFTWVDDGHPAMTYDPLSERWEETADFPHEATETPPGPWTIGERFVVPRGMEGAVYDPDEDTWTLVDLPGFGTELNTVWTGEEVLRWDRCCFGPADIDAWRWEPPR